jgi:hypothetical protein
MIRGWYQYSKWRPCLRSILPNISLLLCVFCGQKDPLKRIFTNVYCEKCLSRKAVHNWGKKLSQGRSKVADDARSGRPVETVTEATVQRVEELIRADRRMTIDSVAIALGCSHGLAYSKMHDLLKFPKV